VSHRRSGDILDVLLGFVSSWRVLLFGSELSGVKGCGGE